MGWVKKVKPLVFIVCLLPLVWLSYQVSTNQMGPDPAVALTRGLGEWTLLFLCITLSVTPVRMITGVTDLIRFRRMLGLFVLFYAVLHMLSYVAFMLAWQWSILEDDLWKRPYIIVGASALLILVALGVTSFKAMMRKMGKHWKKLHRLVYLAAILGVVHFTWLVRSDYSEPVLFGVVLAGLLLLRSKRIISWTRLK